MELAKSSLMADSVLFRSEKKPLSIIMCSVCTTTRVPIEVFLPSVWPPGPYSPVILLAQPAVTSLCEPVDLLLPADEEEVPLGQHDEVVVPVQDSSGVAVYEVLQFPETAPRGYTGQLVLDGVDLLL